MSDPIGQLRHRVVLEAAERIAEEGGGASLAWSVVAEVQAAVRPLSGSEAFAADRLGASVTHEVRLRYRAGVTPAMRFRLGARILEIVSVREEDEARRWLVCLCREEVP